MEIGDWDKAEIVRLARESGRPLEVQVARVFREAGWETHISTSYVDPSTQRLRELDVLAERVDGVQYTATSFKKKIGKRKAEDTSAVNCFVQIPISCKGFKATDSAITYSLSSDSLPDRVAPFVFHRAPAEAAEAVFRLTGDLLSTLFPEPRRITGFDIYRATEKPPAAVKYTREQDRDILFEGLDSAIKAGAYWRNIPGEEHVRRSLHLPILVTSRPWWDVPLDHGIVGEPRLCSRGYLKMLYPYLPSSGPVPAVALMWSVTELSALLPVVNRLYERWLDYFVTHPPA